MTTTEIARHQAYIRLWTCGFLQRPRYVPGYTETLQAASTLVAASELLHLYAVSAAVRRPILSTCPLAHDHLKPLTALVVGRNVPPNLPPVNIIWTSVREPQDLYQFTPNRFLRMHAPCSLCNVWTFRVCRPQHTVTSRARSHTIYAHYVVIVAKCLR